MAVTLDAVAVDTLLYATSSVSITTFTVGTGTNRALVVALTIDPTITGITVNWDTAGANQAMTLIGSQEDTTETHATVYLYGLVAPVSGNKTLTAAWSGTDTSATVAPISFTGVNQAGGTASFTNVTTTAGTGIPSATVSSTPGNYVVGAWVVNVAPTSTSATNWYIDGGPSNWSTLGSYAPGAATSTFTAAPTTGVDGWAFCGVNIVAATVTTGLIPNIPFFKRTVATVLNGGPVAVGLIGSGYPATFAPATPGLAGVTVVGNSSTTGGFVYFNPATSTYLAGVQLFNDNAASYFVGIFDLLWYNTGIAITTTTAQTVGSVALPPRDATGTPNGAGVTAWLYCSVATTNSSAITGTTISYTDQNGNTGNTGTIGLAGWPANAVAGTFIPFNLAVGDNGIGSIQTLTLATSYVTGTVNLVMIRHLSSIATPTWSSGVMADWGLTGYSPLYNGTALSFYAIQSAAAAVVISGEISFAQG